MLRFQMSRSYHFELRCLAVLQGRGLRSGKVSSDSPAVIDIAPLGFMCEAIDEQILIVLVLTVTFLAVMLGQKRRRRHGRPRHLLLARTEMNNFTDVQWVLDGKDSSDLTKLTDGGSTSL